MRSDAAKRRQIIIQTAREMFAAHGSGVALESVAEAAGVGVATLYRNFASRAELADAVALAILEDVRQAAAGALDTFTSEPEAAWRGYVHRLVELNLGALTAALSDFLAGELSESVKDAQLVTLRGLEQLQDAAQSAGLVRSDLGALELLLAIGMITRPQPPAIHAAAPNLVPQLVSILLAGMRPGNTPASS